MLGELRESRGRDRRSMGSSEKPGNEKEGEEVVKGMKGAGK